MDPRWTPFAWPPLLCQRLGDIRRPGAAHPTVGPRVLWAPWPELLSCSCSSLSAQIVQAPGTGARSPACVSPWGADPWNLSCSSCPIAPVSVSAGSVSQPGLTQPASLSAPLGAPARLPDCTLSSVSVGG